MWRRGVAVAALAAVLAGLVWFRSDAIRSERSPDGVPVDAAAADDEVSPARIPRGEKPASPDAAESVAPAGDDDPSVCRVRGVVVCDGEPAAGAKVRAHRGEDEARDTVADANGRFTLDLEPPGRWILRGAGGGVATLPYMGDQPVEVVAEPGTTLDVRLATSRLASVEGRVTGTDGGSLSDVSVEVFGRWVRRRSTTDAEGAYRLADVPPDSTATIHFVRDGLGRRSRPAHDLTPGETRRIDVQLGVAQQLELVLLDEDDAPVTDAFVWVNTKADGALHSIDPSDCFEPDERGVVVVPELPEGGVRVTINSETHTDRVGLGVDPAETPRLVVRLSKGVVIAGRVVDADGEPIADLRLTAADAASPFPVHGTRTRTDDGGRFRFGALAPGRYVVSSSDLGYEPLAEVDAGTDDVVIRLASDARPHRVHVRAVDEAGNRLPGVRIGSWQIHGTALGGGATGRPGSTGQSLVLGPRSRRLGVLLSEPWDDEGRPSGHGHRFVVVDADSPAELEVELPPEASAKGRVTDGDGNPIPDARIVAYCVPPAPFQDDDRRTLGSAVSDADGRFSLAGIGPGPIDLSAQATGFIPVTLRVEAPFSDLELTATPGVSVRLSILGADGRPLAGARVSVREATAGRFDPVVTAADAGSDGEVSLGGLRDGRPYRLDVHAPAVDAPPRHQDLHVQDWRPADGEIRLRRRWTVRVALEIDGDARIDHSTTLEAVQGELRSTGVRFGGASYVLDVPGPGRWDVRLVRRADRAVLAETEAVADGEPVELTYRAR